MKICWLPRLVASSLCRGKVDEHVVGSSFSEWELLRKNESDKSPLEVHNDLLGSDLHRLAGRLCDRDVRQVQRKLVAVEGQPDDDGDDDNHGDKHDHWS